LPPAGPDALPRAARWPSLALNLQSPQDYETQVEQRTCPMLASTHDRQQPGHYHDNGHHFWGHTIHRAQHDRFLKIGTGALFADNYFVSP
jgi:hypothetical protein